MSKPRTAHTGNLLTSCSFRFRQDAAFEAYILSNHAYDCHLLWIDRHSISDHGVCYWPEASGLYYMENAMWGFQGIYGPFNSANEIGSHVYANLVAKDGQHAPYTVHNYDNTPYGVDWADFNNLLSFL